MYTYPILAAVTVLVSLLISAALVILIRRAATARGFVAAPSDDRFHTEPTPLGGGVAILLAILLPSLLAAALAQYWGSTGAPSWLPEAVRVHVEGAATRVSMATVILAGAVVLCLAGLLDDRFGLGPWLKLIVQAVVAIAVVHVADVRILTMLGGPVSTVLSVLWMLVIINALNFLDNMDGLAAGVALIVACALLAAAASMGQLFVSAWLCVLIGATAGFLLFNFPPARIFMGDAGSLVLGYFLAILSMLTTYYDPEAAAARRMYGVLVPLIVLAVPLYDFASVMFIRIREKRNPMVGDTRHFSHRLVGRGMTVRAAVLTIYLCTAVTGIAAILLPHVPDWGAILLGAQVLGMLGIVALLESANEGT